MRAIILRLYENGKRIADAVVRSVVPRGTVAVLLGSDGVDLLPPLVAVCLVECNEDALLLSGAERTSGDRAEQLGRIGFDSSLAK